MSDFYLKKPVLIEGAASHWNPAVFSRNNLKQNYSQLPVSALQKIGDKFDHQCDGVNPIQTTLGAYYDAGLTLPRDLMPEGGMPNEPWYIFDRLSLNAAEDKLFPASAQLLRDEPSLPLVFLGPDVDMILSIGGVGSGTQFHHHSDGFSVLLQGHKRWFMTPGTDTPLPVFPADNIPIRLYASELFPMLEPGEQGFHCVQRPNDLMCTFCSSVLERCWCVALTLMLPANSFLLVSLYVHAFARVQMSQRVGTTRQKIWTKLLLSLGRALSEVLLPRSCD